MDRRTFIGGIAGLGLIGAGAVGWEVFAPERATGVDVDRTGGSADSDTATGSIEGGGGSDGGSGGGATVGKRGTFEGKDGHRCSGTVELAEDADGFFLQFREYEQTQGPDVYCYLTPGEDPDTKTAIEAGIKVPIDGGADGGELTKTGTFVQSLPDDIDPDAMNGVASWCDAFSVPFGAATISDV